MNINTFRLSCSMLVASLIFLLISTSDLKSQTTNTTAEKISIDLTDIPGLSTRMQFYDYLQRNASNLTEPQPGFITIETDNENSNAIRQQYFAALDSIKLLEKRRDKLTSSDIMLDLSAVYGDNLMNNIMGRDAVNDSCHKSFPFCTTNVYTFPAGVNSGTGQSGPNYGCLNSTPNPAWYHMKILTPGNISIFMESSPLRDIDYIVWGPFTDPVMPCQGALTGNKIVSCSYSGNPTETAYIPNGQTGEYYILLITNFSNSPCEITFSKTGGSGETDCTILPPPIGSNSPVCYGDDLFLTAESYPDATYSWTGPNGFTSNQQNPVINNPDLAYSGTYSLEITVDNITSEPITLEAVIAPLSNPDFDFEEVCYGSPNQFTDLSSVEPAGSAITSYSWEFGDGGTSTQSNPAHTYNSPGSYEVTLTTKTGMDYCARSITKTVVVPEYPYVDAGEDQQIPNGWSVDLTGDVTGGTGDISYLWEPQNLVNNPTSLITSTVNLSQTTVFTLTATDNISGCVETDEVVITVTGGALFVQATAAPAVICLGESTQLNATPSGGAGDYTYSWSSSPAGFSSDIRNPQVSPGTTTSYTVAVFDGQLTVTSTVEVEVKPVPAANAGPDQNINVGTAIQLNGSASGGSGSYNYNWSPADSLEDPAAFNVQNPMTKLLNVPTTYQLYILDNNGCSSPADATTVFTAGDYLAVYAQVSEAVICLYENTELSATALGGSGEYSYSWTANNSSWTSNEQNPVVSPTSNTVYTVQANDGFKIVTATVEVTVNSLPEVDIKPSSIPWYSTDTINVCVRDSVWLDGGPNMNYLWTNGSTSRKVRATTNGNWIDFQSWDVVVTNPVTGCQNTDELTIFFDFNACNIGLNELNNVSGLVTINPNPASDKVKLTADQIKEKAQLYIFANDGRLILEKTIAANKHAGIDLIIPTGDLLPGSYHIMLTTATSFASKTLIINK
ncbi:MAG: PKD domain-containing protein [Bacteroidetes bacterium]|nr:PKD domain-containing protein [Bacteroidota bacterium]MBU1579333.1 PKD domain-containing protein [Bacteroidota bacterium]MBU2466158.1 PKD domain-containing protein [Bacteroidota bacterium]MBU2557950.1 PKD domain-containing protein [Bacteroidota bacterium]